VTDLRIYRGDDPTIDVGPVVAGTDVFDITGQTIVFTARDRVDDVVAVIEETGEIVDGPAGMGAVTIPHTATEGFDTDRVLVWDVQISDPLGRRLTLDSGKLYVIRDITRA
jgi:hypothetical protein